MMRGWWLFFAAGLTLVGSIYFAINSCDVAKLEEGQLYSMGIASERRLFDVSEEEDVEEISSVQGENKGVDREETTPCEAEEEEREESSSSALLYGGSYRKSGEFDSSDISKRVREKVEGRMEYEEEPDYRDFAFRDKMEPLVEPLSEDEIAYVFSQIVSTYTVAVPIKGTLEMISFHREGDVLIASARIKLCFDEIAELYHLPWLPEEATFSIRIPCVIKYGKISVKSNKIELKCDTFFLPETLLVFGCNVAFGKKDYRSLFGKAVENVFVNAGIYG